jgi:hypothetical protein
MNWKKLDIVSFLSLIDSESKAFEFCLAHGLLDTEQTCDCGATMARRVNASKVNGCHFVCPRTQCLKRRSALSGSWFSGSKASMRTALLCIAAYAADLTNTQFPFYTGLSSPESAVNWNKFFRDICAQVVEGMEQRRIGGVGLTVEIDESLIYSRKNHVGRLLNAEQEQRWIFGGICRETGHCFITAVLDRKANTLLEALISHVEPGTRVISDGWKAYKNVSQHGFSHNSVNNSLNFVDPTDPTVHTQRVERMWRTLKSIIPKGMSSELRGSYLPEFMLEQENNWYTRTVGERIQLILYTLKGIKFA